jgi:pimeloyl-ACP methyl ester carboxylesterase
MTTDTSTSELDHLRLALEFAGMQVPDVVAPASHHTLLRNQRFHYLDWGGPATAPIVFLHGGGLTAHTWDLVCLALRPAYRCYALDLRGHGDSEWSREMDYSLEAHAGDVYAFITALELVNPVVVGMSLGGGTAVRYATEHLPRALVVIDTGPQTNRAGGRAIIDFMRAPAELDSIDEFIERSMAFNPRRDPRLLRRSLLHNLMRLPDGKWTWKYDRRHFGRIDEGAQDRARQTVWSRVESITCPVLLVRGAESPVLSRESADAFAARLPDVRQAEIAGAGHTVQGDNPGDLSEALVAFLREIGV